MTGRYQEYFESGVCEEKYKELAAAAASPDLLSPDDCFWLGKCLSVCSESESCSLSIYCIERAFELGLTSSSDKERYVDASLLLSRMYIRKGDYTLAMNHLYYLVNNISNTSDSVIVYFLISQIMSDQVFYITKKPDFFFKRLEGLNTETQSKIYAVFLKRINDLMNEHGEYLPELNYDMFYGLKKKYNADYEQPMSENPEYAELDRLYAETESFGFSQKHIVEKKKYEVREETVYYSKPENVIQETAENTAGSLSLYCSISKEGDTVTVTVGPSTAKIERSNNIYTLVKGSKLQSIADKSNTQISENKRSQITSKNLKADSKNPIQLTVQNKINFLSLGDAVNFLVGTKCDSSIPSFEDIPSAPLKFIVVLTTPVNLTDSAAYSEKESEKPRIRSVSKQMSDSLTVDYRPHQKRNNSWMIDCNKAHSVVSLHSIRSKNDYDDCKIIYRLLSNSTILKADERLEGDIKESRLKMFDSGVLTAVNGSPSVLKVMKDISFNSLENLLQFIQIDGEFIKRYGYPFKPKASSQTFSLPKISAETDDEDKDDVIELELSYSILKEDDSSILIFIFSFMNPATGMPM